MTRTPLELCQFLEWDTDFFGYRIASTTQNTLTPELVKEIDKWCLENRIDCLYFLAGSDDAMTVRLAEENNYRQVDVRQVYEINTTDPIPDVTPPDGYTIEIATDADTNDMLHMIDNSFQQTRFYYDLHFTEEQANNLYRKWLIRSIEDDFADKVLVLKEQGKAHAFITCTIKADTKTGIIGLLGVAAESRRQNLGSTSVFAALSYFQQENMEKVQIVTQARNIPANRLYQKCGFRTTAVHLWYHKWFTSDI